MIVMLTRFNKMLLTNLCSLLICYACNVAPLIPIIYPYFNHPNPCRVKASPYLVLFTLTCPAPKP